MATVEGSGDQDGEIRERSPKRMRVESPKANGEAPAKTDRVKGLVPIKAEYLVAGNEADAASTIVDDDAAEAAGKNDANVQRGGKRQKKKGQNKVRDFGNVRDLRGLCSSRALQPEFSPLECGFGDRCRYEHDLRKYLREHKRADLSTLGGKCPAWEAVGICRQGWKCRFLGSHMEERVTDDGRQELCLIRKNDFPSNVGTREDADSVGVVNGVDIDIKVDLGKRRIQMSKSDEYLKWLEMKDTQHSGHDQHQSDETPTQETQDHRAEFVEPPLLPSEKRRIYFGPEMPALAPLTTQGNLPFRRLCVELGAQATYSEMAMGQALIQGHKTDWALMKAYQSEVQPPNARPSADIVAQGYEISKDTRFGAQIAGNKPWNVVKATEVLTHYCPRLRVVDLNCGCPIDGIVSRGAGSALLDNGARLEKILLGMNAVSGEVPITVKIRMGTKDGKPTAEKLVERLLNGSPTVPTSCGVAAITLHGRSRQQRYTRRADWEYIASCAALVNRYREQWDTMSDTAHEIDPRYRPAGGKIYFLGNGDCYSHEDYNEHISQARVDSVMVGRGALIKPWIFEEIASGQHLDKSASERLSLIEKFVRYGLESWGSDEVGVGHVRRFLLEWLSFAHRYVPVGILEHLPPSIQDRAPAWRGRNDLEGLLASENYKDWIKISEMFLGPAGDGFRFTPKHKSNSNHIEAEG